MKQGFQAQTPTGAEARAWRLGIVVPVLNEGPALAQHLQALQALRDRGAWLVVADGGSTDASWDIAQTHADLALRAPRGRAAQMNAGAAALFGTARPNAASANPSPVCTALLFLHADTRLPPDADRLIRQALTGGSGGSGGSGDSGGSADSSAALDSGGRGALGRTGAARWGRFDVRIDAPQRGLRLVETLMNARSRWSGIATGDQAVFVDAALFNQLGGFADIALMEDIELSRRLKRQGRPACLRERVLTSGRRWQTHGLWPTVWLMWRLRWAYFWGADPDALAREYGYRPRQRAN